MQGNSGDMIGLWAVGHSTWETMCHKMMDLREFTHFAHQLRASSAVAVCHPCCVLELITLGSTWSLYLSILAISQLHLSTELLKKLFGFARCPINAPCGAQEESAQPSKIWSSERATQM